MEGEMGSIQFRQSADFQMDTWRPRTILCFDGICPLLHVSHVQCHMLVNGVEGRIVTHTSHEYFDSLRHLFEVGRGHHSD